MTEDKKSLPSGEKLNNSNKNDLSKFGTFLKSTHSSEPISEFHNNVAYAMFEEFMNDFKIEKGSKILDIGCAQGFSMRMFNISEFETHGLTLTQRNMEVCTQKGLNVSILDQTSLDFPDENFDAVWSRHTLNKSVNPYFLLAEIYRVLKSPGYLYLELPAPNTELKHEFDADNYSVFDKEVWRSFLNRLGFEVVDAMDIDFEKTKDKFYSFFIKKN